MFDSCTSVVSSVNWNMYWKKERRLIDGCFSTKFRSLFSKNSGAGPKNSSVNYLSSLYRRAGYIPYNFDNGVSRWNSAWRPTSRHKLAWLCLSGTAANHIMFSLLVELFLFQPRHPISLLIPLHRHHYLPLYLRSFFYPTIRSGPPSTVTNSAGIERIPVIRYCARGTIITVAPYACRRRFPNEPPTPHPPSPPSTHSARRVCGLRNN